MGAGARCILGARGRFCVSWRTWSTKSSRYKSSPVLNSCHQSAKASSTSPMSARRRMKSKAARKRSCCTKPNGALPTRFSNRGCIIQISRMSPASFPRPETSPMRALKTSSIASCSAGCECWRCSKRSAQPSRTSAHNTHANKKLGATGLPSPTLRSVSCKAEVTNGVSARSTTTSSSG